MCFRCWFFHTHKLETQSILGQIYVPLTCKLSKLKAQTNINMLWKPGICSYLPLQWWGHKTRGCFHNIFIIFFYSHSGTGLVKWGLIWTLWLE